MNLDPHKWSPLSVEELAAILCSIRAPDFITAPAAEEGTKGQHGEKALAAGRPRRVKIAEPGYVSRITPGGGGENAGGVTGGHLSTSGQGSYRGFSFSLRGGLLAVRRDGTRKETPARWHPK